MFAPYGGSITYMGIKPDMKKKTKKKKEEEEEPGDKSHFNMAEIEGECAARAVKTAQPLNRFIFNCMGERNQTNK